MADFEIASYRVSQILTRSGSPVLTRRERLLDVTSITQFHGLIVRATLAFSTQFDAWSTTPVVGYAQGLATFAPTMAGWFPLADFDTAYDILRGEKPVFLEYVLQTPGAAASYLTKIALRTGEEPLGEGCVDAGVQAMQAKLDHLPDLGDLVIRKP